MQENQDLDRRLGALADWMLAEALSPEDAAATLTVAIGSIINAACADAFQRARSVKAVIDTLATATGVELRTSHANADGTPKETH